ncbi:heme biosynthesis HemY N-terminal domain-containing protein, partial [Ralstonia pseudosolanacearum]
MRWVFWVALLFAAAVGLALFTELNLSNVVLLYPPYRVDVSLNFVLASLVLVFVVLHLLLRLFHHVTGMPARAAAYRERTRILRASAALRDAMESLFAGRFGRAERLAREAQAWEPQR